MKFLINGDFLCRNLTGIERFAYELTVRLDKLVAKDEIGIFIPKNARTIPQLSNITIIVSDKEIKSFPKWSVTEFYKAQKKNKAVGIDFANTTCLRRPGIAFLHDIYCKLYKKDFKGFRDKLVCAYSCMQYRFVAKKAKKVFTVSDFSRRQIAETYHVNKDNICVIPNGWDHFRSVVADDGIFEKFPQLKGKFYFTLGSLSKRKNLKWIANYASKHPEETFAISGKILSGLIPQELEVLRTLNNVVFLGYVSDGEVKALMSKCKAFILPSYYEGFGIPPLEALSCGAKIVVSNASCLPEIYGDAAHYIDPDNTDCDLNALLQEKVSDGKEILEKFTYDNAAKLFAEELAKL